MMSEARLPGAHVISRAAEIHVKVPAGRFRTAPGPQGRLTEKRRPRPRTPAPPSLGTCPLARFRTSPTRLNYAITPRRSPSVGLRAVVLMVGVLLKMPVSTIRGVAAGSWAKNALPGVMAAHNDERGSAAWCACDQRGG